MTLRIRPSLRDANTPVPPETTELFVQKLKQLQGRKAQYLHSELLSKFVSKDTDPALVRRTRAINKWLATERQNEATNVRLMTIDEEYNILPRVSYGNFMDTVRRFVVDVIGEVPPDEIFNGSFSGGATTSRKRTESHPASKYLGQADVTIDAVEYFREMISDCELWYKMRGMGFFNDPSSDADAELHIVAGNVLFTVLKSSEIDRCACKEPDFNMYMQKGAGLFIRRSLKKVGIDLNDQSRNQRLARLGSVDGSLATLDLTSASDSISTELVFQALPTVWFSTLNALRSKSTKIDDEWHVNEMFSSMGNGFTFELESLLFYCISRAVAYHTGTPGVIGCYGDDLIVPVEIAEGLSFVLSVLGFEVNPKKSFWTGSFRESCGGHYFAGYDITPLYLKKPIEKIQDLIHALNKFRRWCQLDNYDGILDPDGEEIWAEFAQLIPKDLWGGHDHGDKNRLVSYSRPNKPMRLSAVKRKIRNGSGAYLLWLDSRQYAVESSEQSVADRLEEFKRFRLRPARTLGERAIPFPAELDLVTTE